MKDVITDLLKVGFFDVGDYPVVAADKKITPRIIVDKFNAKKEVPPEILEAILNIEDEQIQKKAAGHLLRIVIYAKSISAKGMVLQWFKTNKIKDHVSNTAVSVSILSTSAKEFNRVIGGKKKSEESLQALQKKKVSNKNQLALQKAEIRYDSYDVQIGDKLKSFLEDLDTIYVSLASERK